MGRLRGGIPGRTGQAWTLTNLTPEDLRALRATLHGHPALTKLIRELDFHPLSWGLPRWHRSRG